MRKLHVLEMFLWYSSPYYMRKFELWKMASQRWGFSYEVVGEKTGVTLYSDDAKKEDLPYIWRFMCSNLQLTFESNLV